MNDVDSKLFMDRYRLEDFVECEGNREALAVLRSIAEAVTAGGASGGLSPCYLYGDPGFGKTHLLRAIVTEMNRCKDLAQYICGEDLIDRIQKGFDVEELACWR